MKKYTFVWVVAPLFLACSSVYHSSEGDKGCEVLLPSIAENYEGYCKEGKAHGDGIAAGLHTYEGQFADGLPDGEGTYTWHSNRVYDGKWKDGQQNGFGVLSFTEGGQEKVLSGFWYEGELEVVADDDDPYKIVSKRGVVSPNLRRQSQDYGDRISIAIQRNGESVQNIISDLAVNHSSGNLSSPLNSTFSSDIIVDGVSFPLELLVTYKIPNLMDTTLISNSVRIEIFQPGDYKVTLENN